MFLAKNQFKKSMIRKYLPKSTEELILWYERYVSPITLIAGFVVDAIIVRNVDLWFSNILLFSYLAIASACTLLLNMIIAGTLRGRFWTAIAPFLPAIIQFSFGGLFSGYVILYSQSAALAVSWIFVAILAILLIGNERFRNLYKLIAFQMGLLFFGVFSFLTFFLPIVLGRIGTLVFLIGGLLSLAVMSFLFKSTVYLVPALISERKKVMRVVGSVFLAFNILYFSNAIPPLPLALKEAGVYHNVVKQGDGYVLSAEPRRWYEAYLRYNTVYHKAAGETVFIYSAIFAPTDFSTTILHEWEYYDEKVGVWVITGTFGFPITGGRDGGYRGYTLRENVSAGKWRVNVKTGNGLIIGRIAFTVADVDTLVPTIEVRN
ncbi:MAG: DUF2914 domain-containing protein [Candidatus Kaiserbacteria bacterium]|nr:DUF2914 domain-containing protein [Candidatus Kaiserbacteria bacterium]